AGLPDRIQDEFEQIGLFFQHDPLDERKRPLEIGRPPVGFPDLIQQFRFLEVGGYLPVFDVEGFVISWQWDGKYGILSIQDKSADKALRSQPCSPPAGSNAPPTADPDTSGNR